MKQSLCLLLTFAIFYAGCGTIIHGKYQTVPISSEPIGAVVRASSGQSCICPCEMTLLRDHEYVLVAQLEGHETLQQNVGKDTSGWFWANIILGGIIGGVIDKATGSGDKLVPAKVHFDLVGGKVLGARDEKSELEPIVVIPKCDVCGRDGKKESKWDNVDGKFICPDCLKKQKSSEDKAK